MIAQRKLPGPPALRRGSSPRIDVVAAIRERFDRSTYTALRGVECRLEHGILRLYGRVPCHYVRQVALAVAIEACGALPIVNRIEVLAGSGPCPAPWRRDAIEPPSGRLHVRNAEDRHPEPSPQEESTPCWF